MNPSEILERATQLIEKGWCTGSYVESGGRYCAMGAVRQVTKTPDTLVARRRAVVLLAGELTGRDVDYGVAERKVIDFNDMFATHEQVIQLFQAAARRAHALEAEAVPIPEAAPISEPAPQEALT